MTIGTDSMSMLYGSPDGVMTATSTQMPTMANRRALRRAAASSTPASWRNTSTIGNSKPMPNASIM